MKVLILSCNTGQGHNSAAKAVCEQIQALGGESCVKDVLAYASESYSKIISESYTKIVMHTPKAFGAGYRFCKTMSGAPSAGTFKSLSYMSNMVYSKKLYEDILEEGIDAVVCTHVFAGQAMTHLRHKYELALPLYIISTDYSFCPYYNELDVDRYFIPVKVIKHEFTGMGIPKEKLTASGIPVSARFSELDSMNKEDCKEQLGLELSKRYCLLMSGSMGYGDLYELCDLILQANGEDVNVVVICGNNKKLKNGFDEKYADNNRVITIGYTDKVDRYMKASDVVVTKPGGLSSTEAMVCNVPLVLTKPIPGCETENFNLLTRLGAALGADKTTQAAEKVSLVMSNPEISEHIISMQQKFIKRDSAASIAKYILEGEKGNSNNDESVSDLL